MSQREPPVYTVLLVPRLSEGATRSFEVTGRRLFLLKMGGWILGLLLAATLGIWFLFTRETLENRALEQRVVALQEELTRVSALESQLSDLEARYIRMQEVLTPGGAEEAPGLWLPPAGGAVESATGDPGEAALPTSWPLTERGFVTRSLMESEVQDHTGLDIAIPSGSYIRAAGSGEILEVGEDEVYGRFVRIGHGNGYETLYAHATAVFMEPGALVRRNEVIGLTGSTGRSTAPHLHFEILLDRRHVDPLTMVNQP